MSDVDEDTAGALGRQRSIFSGMGRVRQIHQIREKWSTSRTKLLPPDAGARRGAAKKFAAVQRSEAESDAERGGAGAFKGERRRLQRALTASDLERYRSIALWLSGNGIDVAEAPGVAAPAAAVGAEVFDDVLHSLDALEKSVEGELAKMASSTKTQGDDDLSRLETHASGTASAVQPPVCDYVVVVGPDIADIAGKNYWKRQEDIFEATVAFACPPQCQFNAESIEHFCFPRGIKILPGCDSSDLTVAGEFFVLLLSGGGAQGQTVQYAFCMKGSVRLPNGTNSTSVVPICYCIVSQLPLVSFFRDLLKRLLDDVTRDSSATESLLTCNVVSNEHSHFVDEVLRKLSRVQFHGNGPMIAIDMFPQQEQPLLLPLRVIDEGDGKHTMLLQWSLPLLLTNLTIDQILQILAMLLTEMKVIMVSEQLSLLSSATLGLPSMLQPLSWVGPLITVLPPLLHEYMEAPVPLICGVDILPASYEVVSGVAIVYLDEHRIILHPQDAGEAANLKIPGASDLCRDLAIFTNQIKQPKSERIVSFGVDVVIRRVRLHIQQLLDSCTQLEIQKIAESAPIAKRNELKFMQSLMQSQMYQKYRDDHPLPATLSSDLASGAHADAEEIKTTEGNCVEPECEENKQYFKKAVDTIFRIAFTGVNEVNESLESPPREAFGEFNFAALHGRKSGDFEANSDEIDGLRLPTPPNKNMVSENMVGNNIAGASHSIGDNQFELPVSRLEHVEAESVVNDNDGSFDLRSRSEFQSPIAKTVASSHTILSEIEAEINLCRVDCEHFPLRRDDTETTLSLLGTTFSDTILRSGGSFTNSDRLSESSDENFHDCNDSEEEPMQFSSQTNVTIKRNKGDQKDGSSQQTTASCVKIQRIWRDWIARRRAPIGQQPINISYNSSLLYADTASDLLHRPKTILHEIDVLKNGVEVRKISDINNYIDGRLCVNEELSQLIWVQEAPMLTGERVITDLASVRRISSRVPSSDDGGYSPNRQLATNIYFDGGTIWRFQHNMAVHDFFCFLRWITMAATSSGENESSTSLASAPINSSFPSTIDPTSESAIINSASSVRNIEAISSWHDRDCLDKFKTALRSGFLVEKHGRTGKPHVKIIFSDATCSRLMWKKPPAQALSSSDPNGSLVKKALFRQKGIFISGITTILLGKQTLVFNRSIAKSADETLCLSIVSTTRTLDIRAYSFEDYELLSCGLSLLVKLHGAGRHRDPRAK